MDIERVNAIGTLLDDLANKFGSGVNRPYAEMLDDVTAALAAASQRGWNRGYDEAYKFWAVASARAAERDKT